MAGLADERPPEPAGAERPREPEAARAGADGVLDLPGVEAEPEGTHPGVDPKGLVRGRSRERRRHLPEATPGRISAPKRVRKLTGNWYTTGVGTTEGGRMIEVLVETGTYEGGWKYAARIGELAPEDAVDAARLLWDESYTGVQGARRRVTFTNEATDEVVRRMEARP